MIGSSTGRKAWFGHSEHLVFGLPQRPRTHSFPQAGEYPDFPDLAFSHRRGKTSGRPRKRSLKRRTFSTDVRTEVAVGAGLASRCTGTVSVRDWRKDSTFARASARARVRRSSSASASSIALAKRSCWSVLPKPRDRTRRLLPAVLPCGEESYKGRQPCSFVCSHQRRQQGLVHVFPAKPHRPLIWEPLPYTIDSMKAKTPHWSLVHVKMLVANDKLFIQPTRALAFFEDRTAATVAVKKVVSDLNQRSFHGTEVQTYDTCDVYGVRWEGDGWYLKICVDETMPEVAVLSFHPLERPLRTNGGMVNPKPTK